MIRRLRKSRGFTLVELMIVVAIIGILAALAIYGVKKYLTNAKTGEAKNNIGRLGKDAVSAFERESMSGTLLTAAGTAAGVNQLCPSVTTKVPATVPKGEKLQPNPAIYNSDPGWSCLRFTVNSPVYYQYDYTSTSPASQTAAAFDAMARGDLNGDGTAGTWTLKGGIVTAGVMRLAPTVIEPTNTEE